MRICILNDSYENSESSIGEHDLPCDPTPYLDGHSCEQVFLSKSTAVKQIIKLSKRDFQVYINLCDGAWDEDRPGIEVVQTLERLGLAFTGADSSFYEPSREVMKRVCYAWGIKTPAYAFASCRQDMENASKKLRFPMIVKHPNSYSSIGLTEQSMVQTNEELFSQCKKMIDEFGSALIEEFIKGREFTVLVAENPDQSDYPTVYEPVEIRFPAGESFKYFDLKWINYEGMSSVPCEDLNISERLKDISRKLFLGLNGTGYGRCDVRMGSDGELYMLEINPNCGVFYPEDSPGSADLILMNDTAGYRGFLKHIIEAALRRKKRRIRNWEIISKRKGYGMFAERKIEKGEVIEANEEKQHFLVTKSHVEKHWDWLKKSWFGSYAYPLTDEIYVMWSSDPEDWRPINHSCDPNSWLQDLNLVSRREIKEGEEITIDYATFCNEEMESFSCSCGSAECRGIIRGTDYLEPFIEKYGDHVSDYVMGKRERKMRE